MVTRGYSDSYSWSLTLMQTCGTAEFPKIPLRTAIQRPTMTSSLTFSMMAAASPATSANKTGARYKFQNRNSSPKGNMEYTGHTDNTVKYITHTVHLIENIPDK